MRLIWIHQRISRPLVAICDIKYIYRIKHDTSLNIFDLKKNIFLNKKFINFFPFLVLPNSLKMAMQEIEAAGVQAIKAAGMQAATAAGLEQPDEIMSDDDQVSWAS